MLKKLSLLAYFGLALLLMNCKGDDGAIGPAGATGAAGPKGDAGTTGPAGPAGASGAARYYTSGPDTTDAKGFLYKAIAAPTAADETFWANAVVLIFVKVSGVYWALPGSVTFPGNTESTFGYYHGFSEKVFYAEVTQKDWTGKSPENAMPPVRIVQDMRLVAVPAAKMRLNGEVDWSDFGQVTAALGLTEKDLVALQ
jgi:hypothetical protein